MIYQFACQEIFPSLRKTTIYHPRLTGSLCVMNVSAQQKVLQNWYIRAILHNNCIDRPIPAFLLQLLVSCIQSAFDCPYHEVPLLFPKACKSTHLSGLHTLSVILKAIDDCPLSSSWDDRKLNLPACLETPFVDLCQSGQICPQILDSATIQLQKAPYFLKIDPSSGLLRFEKKRQECKSPVLLSRIHKVHKDGSLLLLPFSQG
ncbi:uncharacterized protein B0P05DRAFT_30396 [Gilbertella persicaria]|uniref:uncharacterized protein n=1 Tax=Gilbertella persicaria TaxID=101096 RepID=UPI00221FCD3A|nr:uncharacterized protein B0P05DRAFT_30396 [Gilbertella persicaria]KAI8084191.1 hypothetical protein B0P05DRAFT_30396 [Gilbertella persicaria]